MTEAQYRLTRPEVTDAIDGEFTLLSSRLHEAWFDLAEVLKNLSEALREAEAASRHLTRMALDRPAVRSQPELIEDQD
jgi:hypothetical protein